MKFLKKLGYAAFGLGFMAIAATAANIPLLTGPLDPSGMLGTLNQLITSINSNIQLKLYANGTVVNTTAVTTEETLYTYTLPANSLNSNTKSLRLKCGATTAATANNKTLKLYFGSAVYSTGAVAANAGAFNLEVIVVRTGAATQMFWGSGTGGTGGITPIIPAYTAATEDLTAAVTIKCTGQNGTAAANDISGKFMMVEAIN